MNCRNSEAYLYQAIESVYKQTFKNWEIILYDNDSIDNTEKIAKSFCSKLKYHKSPFYRNLYDARNQALSFCSGEIITFLDSDDIWNKKKLETQIMFMKNKNILASHTSYQIVDLNGRIISVRHARNLTYEDLLKSCDIGLSTVVLNKKIIKNDRKLFPNLVTKEDFVLWLKISKKGLKFYGINKYLTKWTSTPNSLSKSISQKICDAFRVYKNFQNMSIFKSICYTFLLSINYIFKKWK